MVLTRSYRETVIERIQEDPKFAAALYAEAITALLDGEKRVCLGMLRNLVHACISFKELALQTGIGEKTLHRMLGPNGNPTMQNLILIIHTLGEHMGLKPHVTADYEKPKGPKKRSISKVA